MGRRQLVFARSGCEWLTSPAGLSEQNVSVWIGVEVWLWLTLGAVQIDLVSTIWRELAMRRGSFQAISSAGLLIEAATTELLPIGWTVSGIN